MCKLCSNNFAVRTIWFMVTVLKKVHMIDGEELIIILFFLIMSDFIITDISAFFISSLVHLFIIVLPNIFLLVMWNCAGEGDCKESVGTDVNQDGYGICNSCLYLIRGINIYLISIFI